MMTTDNTHALDNARAWLARIVETYMEWSEAFDASNYDRSDELERDLCDSALSIEVRSEWHTPGMSPDELEAGEYRIGLTWGGPALRIVGTLSSNQPASACLQWQDWGTPWTDYPTTTAEADALLWMAERFYWGD